MGLDLTEGLERAHVVFSSRLETDVAEIWGIWDQRAEQVAEHGAVGVAILGLGGAAGPRDVEDVGDVSQLGELNLGVVWVGDVALNVLDRVIIVPSGPRPSCDAVYLPWTAWGVRKREDFG